MHKVTRIGLEADLLRKNAAYQHLLKEWRIIAERQMIKAAPFDNETRITAKITLDNIDFLANFVDSMILDGRNAGFLLSGGEPMEEVGIL